MVHWEFDLRQMLTPCLETILNYIGKAGKHWRRKATDLGVRVDGKSVKLKMYVFVF